MGPIEFDKVFHKVSPGFENDFEFEIVTDAERYFTHDLIFLKENLYLIAFDGFVLEEQKITVPTKKGEPLQKSEKKFIPIHKVIMPISHIKLILTNFV